MPFVRFLILFITLVLSGCSAIFIEKGIAPPKNFTVEQKNKPNVLINIKAINGNPGKTIKFDPRVQGSAQEILADILDRHKLFNYYTFDKNQIDNEDIIFDRSNIENKKEIDYTLDVGFFYNYDKSWVDWIPITQLFSLGLLPVYYTSELTISIKVYDKNNRLVQSGKNSITMKNWGSWWVLPLSFADDTSTIGKLIVFQIETLLQECINNHTFNCKQTD